jgi:hypothetical protein
MNGSIILEKGYNTSGIYTFLTSLFCHRSDSVNRILNIDSSNVSVTYIQEFIKSEFLNRLQMSKSIPVVLPNRFRILLFNYGWKKDNDDIIDQLLQDVNPEELHRFLICNIMDNKLVFERVDSKMNTVDIVKVDMISINEECVKYSDDTDSVVDLSKSIGNWIQNFIIESDRYSYRFKDIPHLVSISLNFDRCNSPPIDIKHAIQFKNINDSVQKIFTWDIHSVILYNVDTNSYSSLIIDDENNWYIFSEDTIPSNVKIDMSDTLTVQKISRQIKVVYYKIK